ncbi:MAG: hypothetical protein ACOCRK_06320 [bacterium]
MKKYKKIILLIITALVVIMSGVLGVLRYNENKKIDKVMKYVKVEKFINAKDSMDGITNENTIKRLKNKFKNELISLTDEYINEEIKASEFEDKVRGYLDIDKEYIEEMLNRNATDLVDKYIETNKNIDIIQNYIDSLDDCNIDVSEVEDKTDKYKKSRSNFLKAKEYYDEEKYLSSLTSLEKVIEEDKMYSDDAEKLKEKCITNMLPQYEDKVKKLNKEGESDTAYEHLIKIEKYYTENTKFKELLNKQIILYKDKVLKDAEEDANNKEFDAAINKIQNLIKKFPDEETNLQELYINYKQDKNKYLQEKMTTLDKEIVEIENKLNVSYDDMNSTTTIVPKGQSTRYINIDWNRNIDIRITRGDSDLVMNMTVVFGFRRGDWIFMDNIKFNVDGDRYNWKIDYFERKTDISGGNIAEWYGRNSLSYPNIINELEKIATSEKTKIRFSGDGYIDKIIPQRDKDNIKLMLNYYNKFNERKEIKEQLMDI